jgi:hypothetical protein
VNKKEQDSLAVILDALENAPHRLVSLWDMIEFSLLHFGLALNRLDDEKGKIAKAIEKEGQSGCPSDADKVMLEEVLQTISKECRLLKLQESENRSDEIIHLLRGYSATMFQVAVNFQTLKTHLDGLDNSIFEDIQPFKCICLERGEDQYFERGEPDEQGKQDERGPLFGTAVNKAFPKAAPEIKEAGNCLALGLNTAAVFHLMRVSEYGLRVLAERLGAIPTKWPIEFSQWKDVIVGIESKLKSKVEAVDQMTKGYDKDQDLDFYNGLMADVRHLKISRDRIMHAREYYYNRLDALAVCARVEDIMRKLAEKVSEK